jgi:predicted ABC-type ATPase
MTGMDTALSMAQAASGRPQCIIVAGPNGAGKTTTALGLASEWHKVPRIVNPDEIAGGLSGAPELGALEAGKLALKAQARYMAHRQDFAMETTLSGRRWPKFLDALDAADYQVTLYYLWVADPAACIARVRTRVMKGGHGVAEDEIRRRYGSGLENLQQVFAPRVDAWHVADANAQPGVGLRYVAHGGRGVPVMVVDPDAWADLQRATRTKTTIPPSRPRTA